MHKAVARGILLFVCLPAICGAKQTSTSSQTASGTGASYNVNLSTSVNSPAQISPPKYLVQICAFATTVADAKTPDLTGNGHPATKSPAEATSSKKPPMVSDPCAATAEPASYPTDPAKEEPIKAGTTVQEIRIIPPLLTPRMWGPPFQINATADSKTPPVTLEVVSGPATVSGLIVTITGAGKVELIASQPGDAKYAAVKTSINFDISPNDEYCLPDLMPAMTAKKQSDEPTQTDKIIQYLGNPSPFSFAKLAEGKIAIYVSRYPLAPSDNLKLTNIKARIKELAGIKDLPAIPPSTTTQQTQSGSAAIQTPSSGGSASAQTPPAYSIEISVPHYSALGDLATKFSPINPNTFSVQDIGRDKIRISSQSMPTCQAITQFLRDVRDIAWQTYSSPPVAKVFHLQASDVTGPLGGGSSGAGGGGNPPVSPAASQPANSPSNAAPQQGLAGAAPTGGTTATNQSGGNSQNGVTGSTAPVTGSGSGGQPAAQNNSAAAGAGQGGSVGVSPSAKSAIGVAGVSTDLLLLSDQNPGDDSGIQEVKRVLAQLDLPRPEIRISAWSMQASSTNPALIGDFHKKLEETVDNYNDGLQKAVERAWEYLKGRMTETDPRKRYFNDEFYRYVTGRYVEELLPATDGKTSGSAVRDFLRKRDSLTPMKVSDDDRAQLGMCKSREYCLGYTTLFQALKPRLTDMLLAVIAAENPGGETEIALNQMECESEESCVKSPPVEYAHCQSTFDDPCPDADHLKSQPASCERSDQYNELYSMRVGRRPTLFLECFRRVATQLLMPRRGQESDRPLPIGLTRAAIADFLFNYKMAQEFPHDFEPYYLSQSAQALDSALSPFTDAFNRDIGAYQEFLRDRLIEGQTKERSGFAKGWLGQDKSTFINDGIITVRTLSGKEATVSTASQNFLDATQQPTISGLLSSIEAAKGSPSTTTGQMTDVLQNLKPIQAQLLEGVLNSVQSSKIQVGRLLSVDVTPRGQAGASAAELTVNMKADDSASPTYYTPPGSTASGNGSAADVSRVSQHDVTTTVRVESIKLFEVSSFSAVLQRSRSRFPLLPPFVEIPYVGTLIGIPMPGAKEYHSSTAIMSAIVVPTAADLADGLIFVLDRIVNDSNAKDCGWPSKRTAAQSACTSRIAQTLRDLLNPVAGFHVMKINCLATGKPLSNLLQSGEKEALTCAALTFDSVPGEGQ